VLDELAERPERNEKGQFVPNGLASAKTLERSEAWWSAVASAKRDLVADVQTDCAVDGQTASTMYGLIDSYAEARLLRTAMFMRLTDLGGPVTTKGKARALYRAYLLALDREIKLAQILGLDRRQRTLTPSEALMQSPEAR
jgi:hypothetical protein